MRGKKIRLLTLGISILAISACSSKNNEFRDQYRWLSGKWTGQRDDIKLFESWKWNKYRFEGYAYELQGDDTLFKEHLFLEDFEGRPSYIVVIKDREPLLFHRVPGKENELIFQNQEHDFPSVIKYSHEADTTLTVSLMTREKPTEAEISYQLKRTK